MNLVVRVALDDRDILNVDQLLFFRLFELLEDFVGGVFLGKCGDE